MHALVIGRPPPTHLSKSPGSSLTCTIVHACLAWRVQDKNLKGGFFKQMSNKLKPSRQGADYPDIGEPAAVQYDQVNNNYGGFDNAANMRSPGRAPRVSGNPGGGAPPWATSTSATLARPTRARATLRPCPSSSSRGGGPAIEPALRYSPAPAAAAGGVDRLLSLRYATALPQQLQQGGWTGY